MIKVKSPTPKQFDKFLADHKLSKTKAAEITGLDRKTLQRYSDGSVVCRPIMWAGFQALILKHQGKLD